MPVTGIGRAARLRFPTGGTLRRKRTRKGFVMLEIGEKVVYQHRVCTATGIREAYFDGRDYYELEALYERALKLFIPVEKAVPPDFRSVMTEREALSLIDSIKDIDDITPEEIESSATSVPFDRREESEYSRRLHYFSPDQLIRIMRFSYERSQARSARGRAATETDKRYLRLAQDLLCDELAVSLNLDREKTPEFLLHRIEKVMSGAA